MTLLYSGFQYRQFADTAQRVGTLCMLCFNEQASMLSGRVLAIAIVSGLNLPAQDPVAAAKQWRVEHQAGILAGSLHC